MVTFKGYKIIKRYGDYYVILRKKLALYMSSYMHAKCIFCKEKCGR